MKNPNDATGNRTRDHPACSAMPKPTEPPRFPLIFAAFSNIPLKCMYLNRDRNHIAQHVSAEKTLHERAAFCFEVITLQT
jgi:hypothetical protein